MASLVEAKPREIDEANGHGIELRPKLPSLCWQKSLSCTVGKLAGFANQLTKRMKGLRRRRNVCSRRTREYSERPGSVRSGQHRSPPYGAWDFSHPYGPTGTASTLDSPMRA